MYTELNQLAAWCLPKRLQQLGYSVQALAVWRWALQNELSRARHNAKDV